MGHNWTLGALQNSQSKLGDRLVLLALAESADIDTGIAYPSVGTIARRANMSERAVQYSLRRLVALGELHVADGKSEYGTNRYQIDRSLLRHHRGADIAPVQILQGVQNPTQNMQDFAPKPLVKPSVRKKNSTSSQKAIAGFAEWYAIYPKKTGRLDAERAWAKRTDDERTEAMTGLLKLLPDYQNREPRHIPNPATFLNQHRWEDEPILPHRNGHAKPRSDMPTWYYEGSTAYDLTKPENAKYIPLAIAQQERGHAAD